MQSIAKVKSWLKDRSLPAVLSVTLIQPLAVKPGEYLEISLIKDLHVKVFASSLSPLIISFTTLRLGVTHLAANLRKKSFLMHKAKG